jgi:hypothetical protein
MQRRACVRLIILAPLMLLALQPAYANGGHVHLGGIFFLLLGGVVFIGGLAMVFYLLFRSDPEAQPEEDHDE